MSIKSILCVFSGQPYDLNALDAAFAIRQECHARLRILHIAEPPILAETLAAGGLGIGAYGGGTVVEVLEREGRERHDMALRLSGERADKNGLALEGIGVPLNVKDGRESVVFRTRIGSPVECLNAEGRTVDLVVTGFDNQPGGDQETVRAALYQTGRPLLLLPRITEAAFSAKGFPDTVALAWDGSLSAARAMRDALPFLLRAKDVYVLMAEEDGRYPAQGHQTDVMGYLESHGIFCECLHIPRGGGVGSRLLAKSGAVGAGLLIMGAYGRGHVGEVLLGGATQHVLQASHVPLLVSH